MLTTRDWLIVGIVTGVPIGLVLLDELRLWLARRRDARRVTEVDLIHWSRGRRL